MRSVPFEKGSYYLVTNRGVDSRNILISQEDYDRFETCLYLLNDTDNPRAANFFLRKNRPTDLSEHKRMQQLVAIGGYVLLPEGFQILLTPLHENGISMFMQKISTAYSMYFNDKYQRSGRLFESTFKARKLNDDKDLKAAIANIHLSPIKLFDHDLNTASLLDVESVAGSLMQYRYSSIGEYVGRKFVIISIHSFPQYLQRANHIDTFIRYWANAKQSHED